MTNFEKTLTKPNMVSVAVWDLPVRLVHWLLVILIGASWITAENGWLEWHRLSGYGVLALVLFRIFWGFVGSTSARFASFMRGPHAVYQYICGLGGGKHSKPEVGHNPLGGWSAMAMLVFIAVQAGLGLYAVDVDGIESGPLASHISFELGRRISQWHETLFNIIAFVIAIHILAIIAYWHFKRDNLLLPMLNGSKKLLADAPRAEFHSVSIWKAILGLIVCMALVAWIANGFSW